MKLVPNLSSGTRFSVITRNNWILNTKQYLYRLFHELVVNYLGRPIFQSNGYLDVLNSFKSFDLLVEFGFGFDI